MSGQSPRQYTDDELDAARHIASFVNIGTTEQGRGPLFWADGRYWPERVRRAIAKAELIAASARIVADAMDREWTKPFGEAAPPPLYTDVPEPVRRAGGAQAGDGSGT